MPSRILHARPIPTESVVVEVTTIREVCEFEDLDYPNEDEGIEKLVDAEWTFILWPCKDIIHRRLFHHGAPGLGATLNMPKPTQSSHPSVTPPPTQNLQDPDIHESTGRGPPSPVKDSQGPEL
jgi:hypothetical protein